MLERFFAACLVVQIFLAAKAGDPMEKIVPVSLTLSDPFPLPLPVPVSRCIRSCKGLKDGDYQSCKGCNVYASCAGGILYDQRPCAASLVWDDYKKRCENTSPSCGQNTIKGCMKDGKLFKVGESVLSDDPCDSCTRCKEGGKFECFKQDCAAPPCQNPVRVPGQCCPICEGCTANDGTTYRTGDQVPSGNPCSETCSCAPDGDVVCFPIAISCGEPECDDPITIKGQCCSVCPQVCSLPIISGPCEAAIPRFAYDSILKRCRPFNYGGCAGNGNNFELLADCRAICKQQPKEKCTKDNKEYNPGDIIPTNNPCQERCRCTKGGVTSCFRIAVKCARPPCKNPKRVKGKCCEVCPKVSVCVEGRRTYKDGAKVKRKDPCKTCRCYKDGNIRCRKVRCPVYRCSTKLIRIRGNCCPKCQPTACTLPKKTGRCKALFRRYYYNTKTGRCERFIFGGCGANKNNFQTKKACEFKCGMPEKNVCVEGKRTYKVGQSFNRDPCTFCQCTKGGNVVCAVKDCARPPCENYFVPKGQCCPVCPTEGCVKNGRTYAVGQSIPVDDPCRSPCVCTERGEVCAIVDCFFPAPCKNPVRVKGKCCQECPPKVCNFKKRTYKEGQNFRDNDTCKICRCRNGKVSCGRKACPRYKCKTRLIKVKGRCCPICQPPVCRLAKAVGPCDAALPRYYYNFRTGKCAKFSYGGCGGNENNFKSLNACLKRCVKKPPVNVCRLWKAVGPCKAAIPRYFYNFKTGECTKFSYGGCGGNKNNFRSLNACKSRCDKKQQVNVCRLRKAVGPCKGSIPRYYYNFRTGKCTKFTYGGCRGNKNNFKTLKACKKRCVKKPPVNVCRLRKAVGPCKGSIPRYYYNFRTGKCTKFTYGGCRGNKNNFKTLKACKKGCVKKPLVNVCKLPKKPGPCRGSFKRYFYNSNTKGCEKFIYGGCLGNGNNFTSLKRCKKTCVSKPKGCSLPQKIGRCRARIKRYFYNENAGKCLQFYYGGCGGNKNNFKSLKQCQKTCIG